MTASTIPVDRSDPTYEIHEVAELTGLAPARLRAWERRYEVVRPVRRPNGYRAYTAAQVALLRAFARLIDAGERIGDLVQRPREEVLAHAEKHFPADSPQAALLAAVQRFDRERLEGLIAQQLALRGLRSFASDVVLPLAEAVGDMWALGKLPIAGEHLASEVVLHALKGGLRMSRGAGPTVVAGCLPGERHEWGVLATLAIVQEDGWRVHYLGADLPVEEIVEAGWKLAPTVVGLSCSNPGIVRACLPALAALPGKLPPGTLAVAGGAGMAPHARLLDGYGYRIGIGAFREALH
ncbi:MAG TPA: MerR family transcriptional regulator [Gemmatimonadales bacterium]|nr:MerR family transcriptional regulator [Gemmatimonadales bacterium]